MRRALAVVLLVIGLAIAAIAAVKLSERYSSSDTYTVDTVRK